MTAEYRDRWRISRKLPLLLIALLALGATNYQVIAEEEASRNIDEIIDDTLEPVASVAEDIVFWAVPLPGGKAIPLVLIILGITAIFLTIYFRFINFRSMGVARRTIQGKYTDPDAPGQISHFRPVPAE